MIPEDSVFEEELVSEETVGEESAAPPTAVAVEGLVYTGEPQELILPVPGSWMYSLDGETYTSDIATAINAGEYKVYLKEGEAAPIVVTVYIAKADVIITPPVANTTTNTTIDEAAEEPTEGGEEPAYTAGEENA